MKLDDTLTTTVMEDINAGIVPALMGESGIGKSSFTEALADLMGGACFTVQCNLLSDKADLTGARLLEYTKADGTKDYKQAFFPHEDISDCIDYALANPDKIALLFLDEINRSNADVTSGSLGISTARKIGRKRLPENVRLVIAGNLKGNVTTLDEASLSRFAIYNVEPDAPTLIKVLGDKMNPWVKSVLTRFPELVFCRKVSSVQVVDGSDDDGDATATVMDLYDTGDEMNQITTPRTIENVSKWLNSVQHDTTRLVEYLSTPVTVEGRDTNLLTQLIEAKVGETHFATQLVATISADITSGNPSTQAARVSIPRPATWDSLTSAGTITDLSALIGNLSQDDCASALLYAVNQDENHTRMVGCLSDALTGMSSDNTRLLLEMVTKSQHNAENLTAFTESDSAIAQGLRAVLTAYL